MQQCVVTDIIAVGLFVYAASSVAAPPPPKATSSPVPPPPSNHGSNASTHHAPPPAHQPHTASAPPAAQSSGPGARRNIAVFARAQHSVISSCCSLVATFPLESSLAEAVLR
eukprot:6198837-Pleurochrysis_carterae.AAC.1